MPHDIDKVEMSGVAKVYEGHFFNFIAFGTFDDHFMIKICRVNGKLTAKCTVMPAKY